MQIAIWELLNDATPDLTAGNFSVTSASAGALAAANAYLAESDGKFEAGAFLNPNECAPRVGRQGMFAQDSYNFASAATPASLAGRVAAVGTGIAGVQLALTGTDVFGNAVSASAKTAADGSYSFAGLAPGKYTLTETQPQGYSDGAETVGSLGGDTSVNDVFGGIYVGSGQSGTGYNFAEVVSPGSPVAHGQTATIGYWQNNNGHELIASFNGGSTSDRVGPLVGGPVPEPVQLARWQDERPSQPVLRLPVRRNFDQPAENRSPDHGDGARGLRHEHVARR